MEHNERNAVTDLTDHTSHCCNPDSLAKPCPKTWVCNVCIQFLRAIIYLFFFCIEFNIKIEWKTTIQLSVCTSSANNIIVFFAFHTTLWACTNLFHQPINAPPYNRIKSVCVLLMRHITVLRVNRQCSGRVFTISSDCNPFSSSLARIRECREFQGYL